MCQPTLGVRSCHMNMPQRASSVTHEMMRQYVLRITFFLTTLKIKGHLLAGYTVEPAAEPTEQQIEADGKNYDQPNPGESGEQSVMAEELIAEGYDCSKETCHDKEKQHSYN